MLIQPLIRPLCRPLASPLVGQTGIDLPSLDIQFAADRAFTVNTDASASITARRGPPVNFKRLSGATQVNAQGLIEWAPENLVIRSNEMTNASWAKTGITVAETTESAPTGWAHKVFKITEDSSLGAHKAGRDGAGTFNIGAYVNYTSSIYVRGVTGGRNRVLIDIYSTSGILDLTDGTFVTNSAASIRARNAEPASEVGPDGFRWWKFNVTRYHSTTSGGAFYLSLISGTATSYQGDGRVGCLVAGAQGSRGVVYWPYYQTVSTAFYAPRFDYDPVTLQSKGLLIERSSTNLLLNSAALVAQSVTVAAVVHTLSFYGTGTVTLSGAHVQSVVGTGAYPSRKTYSFTPSAGSLGIVVTGTVQFAQLEAKSYASSYIPTTDVEVIRAGEATQITGSDFTKFYRQDEGTLLADYNGASSGSVNYEGYVVLSDGSINNRLLVGETGSAPYGSTLITKAGTQQYAHEFLPASESRKITLAYRTDDARGANNGALLKQDTIPTEIPLCSSLDITLIGSIKSIQFYRKRLPNAKLQQLTTL